MDVARWEFSDSAFASTVVAAMTTARTGAWDGLDGATRTRYGRTLMVLTLQGGRLGSPAPLDGKEGFPVLGGYKASDYRDKDSLDIASTVLRTPLVLLPAGHYEIAAMRTTDGAAPDIIGPAQGADVALAPIVIVAALALVAVASCVMAKIAGDVTDRQNARSEQTRQLLASHASALDVLAQHTKREEQAKAPIPWAPVEIGVMEALFKAQTSILTREERPLPVPFEAASNGVGSLLAGGGGLLAGAGKGLESGLGIGVPVLAAVGAYLFLNR
jgi:hypothetical protein